MVTVYVLKSLKFKYRYVGITSDLYDRLERHNGKRSRATAAYAPFELLYSEEYPTYDLARVREKFLKSGVGRNWLNALKY